VLQEHDPSRPKPAEHGPEAFVPLDALTIIRR